jgi:hypothetical protein
MEQNCLWEYLLNPKGSGIEDEGNTSGNYRIGMLESIKRGGGAYQATIGISICTRKKPLEKKL